LDKESIGEAKRAIKGRRKQKDKEKQREETTWVITKASKDVTQRSSQTLAN
jgi:hypothetical protein